MAIVPIRSFNCTVMGSYDDVFVCMAVRLKIVNKLKERSNSLYIEDAKKMVNERMNQFLHQFADHEINSMDRCEFYAYALIQVFDELKDEVMRCIETETDHKPIEDMKKELERYKKGILQPTIA